MEKFIKTPPVTSGGTYVIQKGKAVQTRQPGQETSSKPKEANNAKSRAKS